MIVGIQEQIKIFSTQNSITSSWLCLQKCYNPLGAKNNDSHLKKQAIVIFYTPNYRKCGNSNSKNDSRPWTGAFAIPKSVDFRAFAVNVKTIAPTQKLYQSGHAIWCEGAGFFNQKNQLILPLPSCPFNILFITYRIISTEIPVSGKTKIFYHVIFPRF